MTRKFCDSFQQEIVPLVKDADMRFRKPNEKGQEQCRLGISENRSHRKGRDYKQIHLTTNKTGDEVALILECPSVGKNGECFRGGWCEQLKFGDLKVGFSN